jgi:hypothetical protein
MLNQAKKDLVIMEKEETQIVKEEEKESKQRV